MTTDAYEYRRLADSDAEASRTLRREAFGHPAPPADSPPPPPGPGSTMWGVFFRGDLVGRVTGYEFGSWFGGRVLPTVGIGGATIAAEHRGHGLLRGLMSQVLDDHRARGAAISTLFPTAPGVYRGFGYETIGSYDEVVVPASSLARIGAPPSTLRTRRATVADGPALRGVYDTWAASQNGPSTRRGPAFLSDDHDLVADYFAVSVVEDPDGEIRGFASWDRGPGYGSHSHISVTDLLALDADAYRALWSVLGSFSVVTGELKLLTSGADVARYSLPAKDWKVTVEDSYMLRVEDVPAALSGVGVPFAAAFSLSVTGDPLGVLDGTYAVTTVDGATSCVRSDGDDAPVFTPGGLALALAGTQSCANLRMAGMLTGPTAYDALVDHTFGGRQVHVRDYF